MKNTAFSTSPDHKDRAAIIRGAGIRITRLRAFSYDVLDRHGNLLAHRHLHSSAERLALRKSTAKFPVGQGF